LHRLDAEVRVSLVQLLYFAKTDHAVLYFQHCCNADSNNVSRIRVHSAHADDCPSA